MNYKKAIIEVLRLDLYPNSAVMEDNVIFCCLNLRQEIMIYTRLKQIIKVVDISLLLNFTK